MDQIKLLDKKEFTHSFIYTLETGVSGFLSIAFYIFVANYISVSELGAYSLALVYATILAGIANLGLSAGYERTYFEYVNGFHKKGSLICSVQFFSLPILIITVVFGIFFSSQISNIFFGDKNYQLLWVLILIGQNISEFSKFYLAYLKNTRQAKLFSLIHFLQVFINFVLAYIFLVILGKDLYWLGLALLLSHTVTLIIILFHQLKNLPFIINFKDFFVVAKISLPLTPKVLVGFIGTQFDKIIISQLSSLDVLGIYSVAQRISMTIYMFMNALYKVWQPKLYEHLFKKNTELDTEFITVYMYLSLFPSLILILFAQEIIMVFPESYENSYIIIVLLSLHFSTLFMGKINGPQLMFAKKTFILSVLSIINVIVSIAVIYPLVILYEAIGAAGGLLASSIIVSSLIFVIANKYAPIFWNYKKIALIYLYLIIASIIV
ncbi:lipopolysaccharide biosynthesis protein, partial [Alphaproteobacteria bacterium]|nr:lipopolysaccharide biosynthesis protein [Alphaproteobacteria bacterium]